MIGKKWAKKRNDKMESPLLRRISHREGTRWRGGEVDVFPFSNLRVDFSCQHLLGHWDFKSKPTNICILCSSRIPESGTGYFSGSGEAWLASSPPLSCISWPADPNLLCLCIMTFLVNLIHYAKAAWRIWWTSFSMRRIMRFLFISFYALLDFD